MSKKLLQSLRTIGSVSLKLIAVLSLSLGFMLNTACSKDRSQSYTFVIHKGDETRDITFKNGSNLSQVSIPAGSLDAYMTDMGVESVKITVTLPEGNVRLTHLCNKSPHVSKHDKHPGLEYIKTSSEKDYKKTEFRNRRLQPCFT